MYGKIPGIHHVTAIAGDPQRNLDFYAGVLGLRLVKFTVNFDDPGTYHFYFGDAGGRPGTILTFFPWPGAPRGRKGTGQATGTAFSIPDGSTGYWMERLKARGIPFEGPGARFDEEFISFSDPDGLTLELVAHEQADAGEPWEESPVPAQSAIRGFFGVTLPEEACERTAGFLDDTFGFRLAGEENNLFRYQAHGQGRGSVVDVFRLPPGRRGRVAVGTVHHVAFRASSAEEQAEWRTRLAELGIDVTPVIDRVYFRSIYFREPGGVLFEIATDLPGFTVDEPAQRLGSGLMLPPWLESSRSEVEKALPSVRMPGPQRGQRSA